MRPGLFVFAIAGCGSVKATQTDAPVTDDAADIDAPGAACDLAKPFAPAIEVANLHNAAFNDTHATLSADERTIFFASDRDTPVGSAPIFHIYSATRPSVMMPFTAPAQVGALFSTDGESHPSVSPDGNTIFFDSFRPQAGGVVNIFTSTRSSVAVNFPTPTHVTGSGSMIDPAITTDGTVLYAANLSSGQISRFDKSGAGFGVPQTAAFPSQFSICSPVTNDDLTVFLGLGDSTGGEIIATRRPSLTDAFPEPMRVNELKTSAAIAEPSWLSPDGCRLYLTYGELNGRTIIHVATRPQ
jgi:hypothetical protein